MISIADRERMALQTRRSFAPAYVVVDPLGL